MVYKGLHAAFGEKHDPEEAGSLGDGYHNAMQDMENQRPVIDNHHIRFDSRSRTGTMINRLLNELGVSEKLQAYLNISELLFEYGYDLEHFSKDFHLIPTTRNLWVAGNDIAAELVITSCVMEGIAYLNINASRYPSLNSVRIIALGNLPHSLQLEWIRANCQKRKITLVFSSDLLGRLADITIAAGIRNKPVRLCWTGFAITVEANGLSFDEDPDKLTLNVFEQKTSIRTAVRTRKPVRFNTFLDQLKHDKP